MTPRQGRAYKIASGDNGAYLIILGLAALLLFGIFAFYTGGVGALLALAFVNAALAAIAKGVAMMAEALNQPEISSFACNASLIAMGGLVGAALLLSPATGGVTGVAISEMFGVISLFSSC